MDSVTEFRSELEQVGLRPGEIRPDGKLRRCGTADKPRSDNGWYLIHEGPSAVGTFGDWRTGLKQTWCAGGNGRPLDPETRRKIQERIEHDKKDREAEEGRKHAEAAQKARNILKTLPEADVSNPYIARKQIKSCNDLKADGDRLVVPIYDPDTGIMSLQRIEPNGDKRFLPDGRTRGGYFPIKGKDGPLYIAEGIATALSVHESTGTTALVAFTAGNLESVARMARKRYPDREIIITGANDMQTEIKTGKNPGKEAMEAAARAVSGKVALPHFKGEEGTDFNDLHQMEGLEAVKKALDEAKEPPADSKLANLAGGQPQSWPESLPVFGARLNNDPYPLEALPPVIQEAVEEVTDFVQAPVEMVAISALTTVSTVVAGLADVERASKLKGPTSLYMLAIADSGERKSTLDNFFSKAIRDWEAEQAESMKPELAAYKAAFSAGKAKQAGLLNGIKQAAKKGKAVDDLEDRLKALETGKPERPKEPRLLVGDSTTEALMWRLSNGWPVASLLSSEGGLIFGAYSMGKENLMKNLSTLNALWGAEPMSVERKTSESFSIRSARLTVGIAVQGETITRFVDGTRGLARGSGFLARFLIAMPQTRQGYRTYKEFSESSSCLSRYHRRLGALLDEPLNFNVHGDLEPQTLTLSPEAKQIWIAFHNDVETELLPGGELEDTKDVASKAADNVARLAALFHCFEIGLNGPISPEHITNSARLVAWHLIEAKRFMNELALPLEITNAARLDSWLLDYCKKNNVEEIAVTQCLQYGPSGIRRRRWLDAAIFELEDAGRIRCRTEGRKVIITINPDLLEM